MSQRDRAYFFGSRETVLGFPLAPFVWLAERREELEPLRRRLKRNAVPSRNIPLRSLEAKGTPRTGRRKRTADAQEQDAARALVQLQELCSSSEPDKCIQVNTLDISTQKIRISDLMLSDAHLNTLTGVPHHELLNKIVSLVEKYEEAQGLDLDSLACRLSYATAYYVASIKRSLSFDNTSLCFLCEVKDRA
ncbi:hypothetical protein MTO96_006992 [Rhipicephalus appendiculatus]